MTIPAYSKSKHVAEKFFGNVFNYNPELVKKFCEMTSFGSDNRYTEMGRILQRIREVVKLNS